MLSLAADPETGVLGLGVDQLGPDTMSAIAAHLDAGGQLAFLLQVIVAQAQPADEAACPSVAGRYRLTANGIRFVPYFPFQRRLPYRASFHPAPLHQAEPAPILTLDFTLPEHETAPPPRVSHIYPSSDTLPENLLRCYIRFSNPMQRGHADGEISILGPDGCPVADVLYRAPVELWDGTMQVLTVLLDPGRLKRGVGPNRELGPPLEVGRSYTLLVGTGMRDRFGQMLEAPVSKRFHIFEPQRQPVAIDQWDITPPATGSREPLVLNFAAPLDFAMLFNSIAVATQTGDPVNGRIEVGAQEQAWRFTPDQPWASGTYHIRVDPALEDPCGNNLSGAFDRPIRTGSEPAPPAALSFRPTPGWPEDERS